MVTTDLIGTNEELGLKSSLVPQTEPGKENSGTLRWSSSSAPELAWRAGAPSEGAGMTVGGCWKASELGKPLSKPEKYTSQEGWTDFGSPFQCRYISST